MCAESDSDDVSCRVVASRGTRLRLFIVKRSCVPACSRTVRRFGAQKPSDVHGGIRRFLSVGFAANDVPLTRSSPGFFAGSAASGAREETTTCPPPFRPTTVTVPRQNLQLSIFRRAADVRRPSARARQEDVDVARPPPPLLTCPAPPSARSCR